MLRIIDDCLFEQAAYTNAPALLLSRCFQMDPRHLYQLATNVISAGIHLHAQADLPGQFDAYCRTNPNWAGLMQTLFGIDVTAATPGLGLIESDDCYAAINLRVPLNLGPITPGFLADLQTWEMWQRIVPVLRAGHPDRFRISQSHQLLRRIPTLHPIRRCWSMPRTRAGENRAEPLCARRYLQLERDRSVPMGHALRRSARDLSRPFRPEAQNRPERPRRRTCPPELPAMCQRQRAHRAAQRGYQRCYPDPLRPGSPDRTQGRRPLVRRHLGYQFKRRS